MKMPEILVFARMFVIGFVGAEIFRTTYHLGSNFAPTLADLCIWLRGAVVLAVLAICTMYALKRGAHVSAAQMGRSLRLDLFLAIVLGGWSNELALPWFSKFHDALQSADPHWAPVLLLLLCILLISSLVQQSRPSRSETRSQLFFLSDDEIKRETDDLLASEGQAKSFAETVLASGSHSGLVFGVDGPWGVGKTSFINLAERYWDRAADKVIVCRFEPLRYASEPDLSDRLIRDLSAAIQSKVFAPEFRPAASRYSRLVKGKADVSFLGFKLSMEPSAETVDELLDDIDEVLRRIGRRVIVVIDDLDRLDAKTINNVLFATRRTFKLSQATYILCYDTEVLADSKEEGSRAREFLEKFVTVKLSLFVDSTSIRDFLRRDWEKAESQLGSVPSDTMVKLGAVLNELADILQGESAAKYLALVGDLRKVKRFVNAILLMQIEKTNLGRTDFNKRDLINLMLLHLNYPGLFRQIYAEETEGRSGAFSVKWEYDRKSFMNAEGFSQVRDDQKGPSKFLLEQLFDIGALKLGEAGSVEESTLRSRACFNNAQSRNLEGYLKLIVRFATPEPQETFVLYQTAVDQVREGHSISSILSTADFALKSGEKGHDQFWRVLVNQAHRLPSVATEDAIETLVQYMPRYSSFDNDDRGLRPRSVYALLRLLDGVGWGRTAGQRRTNSSENVIEIAWRIFGERAHLDKGLIERLASPRRGVLGWQDLMLFRLQCSADRGGQLYNLQRALIVHQDSTAQTTGLVSKLALTGMRRLSQQVFALFKRTYIDPGRNFFAEASRVPAEDFLGEAFASLVDQAVLPPEPDEVNTSIARRIAVARSSAASFVAYQLSNSSLPNGAGVGCGYYDAAGDEDCGGISRLMNEYIFDHCFNPKDSENVLIFIDHCLSHLSSPFFSDQEGDSYVATKTGIPGGLDSAALGSYWRQCREHIRGMGLQSSGRSVFTTNYTAFYRDDLEGVFTVLDELADEASPLKPSPIA
ncbi:KAP family NTPase [Acidovorax radicis]|uniref:KAP family NTPase n=1 Tax=Acidovorax radicis TaxID=758826 RepID=UPI00023769A7|nr:KAP family NTPase [Acidovorax radicis]